MVSVFGFLRIVSIRTCINPLNSTAVLGRIFAFSNKKLIGTGNFNFSVSNTMIGVAQYTSNSGNTYASFFCSYSTAPNRAGIIATNNNASLTFGYALDGSGGSGSYTQQTFLPSIVAGMYANASNTNNSIIYLNGVAYSNNPATFNITNSGLTNFEIGGTQASSNLSMIGNIAEVIYYNRGISTQELAQTQSYLSIKYGIPLNPTAIPNYLASNGSVIWSGVSNTAYSNSVME